jgi:Flp pilus assembly protein TadB
MNEPLLCVVCSVLLAWVLLVKSEAHHLRRENRKLREALDRATRALKRGVAVSGGQRTLLE